MEIKFIRYISQSGRNRVAIKAVANYDIHHMTLSAQLGLWADKVVKEQKNDGLSREDVSKFIARVFTECKPFRLGDEFTTIGHFDVE